MAQSLQAHLALVPLRLWVAQTGIWGGSPQAIQAVDSGERCRAPLEVRSANWAEGSGDWLAPYHWPYPWGSSSGIRAGAGKRFGTPTTTPKSGPLT